MSIALCVHIMKTIHELVEIASGNQFRESSGLCNEVKKFSPSNIFNNDDIALLRLTIFFKCCIFSYINELNNVFMFEMFHHI